MPGTITNIRSMQNAGVFADRNGQTQSMALRRYNLIYGFNGSGKSTLSRLFASLEAGDLHAKLPEACSFEIALDDGSIFGCPTRPSGLERRLLVFNADYVERNLQWATGFASPVFFIGADQADAAAELAGLETEIIAKGALKLTAEATKKGVEKTFATLKRERARETAGRLHLGSRKYEAPNLAKDYDAWKDEPAKLLSDDGLKSQEDLRRLAEPMPKLSELSTDGLSVGTAYGYILHICGQSLTTVSLTEAQRFPEMLLWLKEGHDFHSQHPEESCLLCGSEIQDTRRKQLAGALDSQIDQFIAKLARTVERLSAVIGNIENLEDGLPATDAVVGELRAAYGDARKDAVQKLRSTRDLLQTLRPVLAQKQARPASPSDVSELAKVDDAVVAEEALRLALEALNQLIMQHNIAVTGFSSNRENAEIAIRRHFISSCLEEFKSQVDELTAASLRWQKASDELDELNRKANVLREVIKAHGPAATTINRLIASYLGHAELAIHPIEQGYELHRHGSPIHGVPSEGEKTAIAIAYFLSSIEAEGRKLKDMIVVVDDPVSSLDTKALNYACALVRNRLREAHQVIILTHNLQCLNEFRKSWKNLVRPSKDKEPTGTFLYLDVAVSTGQARRRTTIVEMSRLLREYDSEYHFLFSHVLKFTDPASDYDDHGYMMPNVLRRVLDVFLAFRLPGSVGLPSQLEKLWKEFPDLDQDRLVAIERLVQVESHSDNLDDLLSFSSMTIEEAKQGAIALLEIIEQVDAKHFAGIKKLCA